nr:unnamed protein product [Spirometra erinaceieuropaei]
MPMDAHREERPWIRLAYRTDGQLLNQLRMHFQSRVSATSVHALPFADDCVLSSTSEGDIQRSMDLFSAACDNFGPAINTEKPVVMHQRPLDTAYVAPRINVNGAQLQVTDKFTYLNVTLSCNTKIDNEVTCRIPKANRAFDRLQNTVWNRHGFHFSTKLKMHEAVFLTTLQYAAATLRPLRCLCNSSVMLSQRVQLGCPFTRQISAFLI